MKLSALGKNTSKVEVQDISKFGVWIYIKGQEYLLPYSEYPWFRDGKVSEIYNVELLHNHHLYWPDLDIDLEIESLKNPDQYPLTYK